MLIRRSGRYPGLRLARSVGFVVSEFIVVLAVTSVLVAIIIISLNGIDRDSERGDCLSQRRALRVAAEQFKANLGFYPPDNAALMSAGLLDRSDAPDWRLVTTDQAAGPVFEVQGSRCADT